MPPADRYGPVMPLLADTVLAVRIEAARMLAGIDARMLDEAGRARLGAVLEEYVDAQLASLDRPQARVNLGNLYADAGDAPAAERYYRSALALDPDFEPAYGNLAQLLADRGDEQGAGQVLAQGLAVRPESAALHHAMGLHHVRSGDRAMALEPLERAAGLAPGNTRYGYVYAVALDGAGRRQEAIDLLEKAHKARQADADVLWALVSMHLQSGNQADAIRYARQLRILRPDDPALRQLLGQLGEE